MARNVAKPLVKYIDNALVGDAAKAAKVTLLVGHDSNIASLLTALDFKPYQLHNQYERTPIGGKLVFQRWHDNGGNRDLMKIEYVYQSTEQLRNADALTLQSPPQRVTLALNGCPVDDNGFCPMDTFKSDGRGDKITEHKKPGAIRVFGYGGRRRSADVARASRSAPPPGSSCKNSRRRYCVPVRATRFCVR